VNAAARPMASRPAAARVSRGGRTASDTANASAAAPNSASAAHLAAGPAVASRCPGNGLAAGVRCRVRPSGNRTTFRSAPPGSRRAAGAAAPIATAPVSVARTENRTAHALARVTASVAARTGTAGQAVALSAQAMPVVTAAARGVSLAASARDIHSRVITGTSVPPVAT
jgi:hypothetical protein